MEISQIIPHVESLIFAADRPLPLLEVLDLLNNALAFLEDRASLEQVETALEAIKEKYSTEFYPFEVKESGGGYQFLTKKEYYQTVAQLNGEKFLKRLSTAALETLAIVAYKQPISKGEIEHIRGVSTDYSIQKLLEKELIVISGRSETLPGKPLLYSTSKAFMDYFGLNSPKDLPKLKEVFDDESIQPTLMGLGGNTESPEEDVLMVVSETGELVEREIPEGEGPNAGLNGHHVDTPEEIPVVDEDIPAKDQEDADENEPAAEGARLTIVGGIPAINETEEEAMEEDVANNDNDTPDNTNDDEDDSAAADDDDVVATDDEIAAFLEAASDLGPKDDEDEDEDEEDEEDDEDDEDDDDTDDEEDDEDEEDEDDEEEDSDEADLDDDDDDSEDEEDEDEDDEEEDDDDNGEEDEDEVDGNGNKKEEDVDDEGFYKDEDEDFGDEDDDDDDEDEDEDNRK